MQRSTRTSCGPPRVVQAACFGYELLTSIITSSTNEMREFHAMHNTQLENKETWQISLQSARRTVSLAIIPHLHNVSFEPEPIPQVRRASVPLLG
jgi:hypothetical protein